MIWTESVPLEEAFRAHRALQLGQEAAQTSGERPAVHAEDLEERSPAPSPHQTPQAASAKRPRGPHADRLAKARAAHEAATQPKPAASKSPAPTDPFDEEEPHG
jgi:hypothetical protein